MRIVRAALVALLALAPGCATYTRISGDERADLQSEFARRQSHQYLKLSFYVTPFFGFAGRRLLTAQAPDQLRWVQDAQGRWVLPGPPEQVLPAGTRVVIDGIEFPTSLAVAARPKLTPRTRAWVLLHTPDAPDRSLVLVLNEDLHSEAAFEAELERFLTRADPGALISHWSRPVQQAVAEKRALVDMPALALEMAWGYPETIHREFPESGRKEVWTWPGGEKKAVLFDGRVTELYGQ